MFGARDEQNWIETHAVRRGGETGEWRSCICVWPEVLWISGWSIIGWWGWRCFGTWLIAWIRLVHVAVRIRKMRVGTYTGDCYWIVHAIILKWEEVRAPVWSFNKYGEWSPRVHTISGWWNAVGSPKFEICVFSNLNFVIKWPPLTLNIYL